MENVNKPFDVNKVFAGVEKSFESINLWTQVVFPKMLSCIRPCQ